MNRVSVIIPAYNAAAFVKDALDCALAQTYPEIEVVVVNDGSTDNTAEILAGYGDRVRVHHQANAGLSAARNIGAAVASGDWLAFLDADDQWMPGKIEAQIATVGDRAWSYTNRLNFGARGDVPELQSEVSEMVDGDVFVPLLLRGNFITVSSVMIRKALFNSVGGFVHQKGGCEDWDLWLRIASQRHEIAYDAEPLVRYRFTE